MQRRTSLIPLVSLLLAGACDAGLADAVDRGDGDPDLVQFRPSGTGTTGGSTRLNTAQLFPEGMPLRHFDRDGDLVIYDDPAATRVKFMSVRVMTGGGGSVLFPATSYDIRSELGTLKVNGVNYTAGQLLGSEWRFQISSAALPTRYFTAKVSGVGIATVPGGLDLPIYNFTLNAGENYWDPGPNSACASLDVVSENNIVLRQVDGTPAGLVNNFKKGFAAVLFGGVKVSEVGVVNADEQMIFLGCVSGAIGKSGLWGYPPWVSTYAGRTGVQQLQAASRAVRADYCHNGVSHTADGTPLQVRDRFFSAFDDATEASESVWGSNGSACKVTHDRLLTGGAFACGGSLVASCEQLASDWITGPDQFMWTKLGPTTTTYVASHACTVVGTPGCNDPGIEAVVCAADPSCCSLKWDSGCVAEVTSLGADDAACCSATADPGCGDAAVSACVATYDPLCESDRWDSYCALEVESLGCGICH